MTTAPYAARLRWLLAEEAIWCYVSMQSRSLLCEGEERGGQATLFCIPCSLGAIQTLILSRVPEAVYGHGGPEQSFESICSAETRGWAGEEERLIRPWSLAQLLASFSLQRMPSPSIHLVMVKGRHFALPLACTQQAHTVEPRCNTGLLCTIWEWARPASCADARFRCF